MTNGPDEFTEGGESPTPLFVSRRRPCSLCGREFETTPARRMLCRRCFARASKVSPFDPEMVTDN